MVFNLARAVERNAWRYRDNLAIHAPDAQWSHSNLEHVVRSFAAGLRRLGIRQRDIVALLMPNNGQFIALTYAINGVGAVFLPLNTRLAPGEWAYIISHAGARALLFDGAYADAAGQLRQQCSDLEIAVSSSSSAQGVDSCLGDLLNTSYDDVTGRFTDVAENDISRLMYTSGTTAHPKGVPLSYRNVLWKIFDHVVEFGLNASDRGLLVGPLYHVGAYDLPGVANLYVGGSVIVLPRFEAANVMKAAQDQRATNLWLAPSMLNSILSVTKPGEFDTTSLRFVTNGGEKMPVSLVERFKQVFPTTWLADSFGMTETVSGDTFLDPASTLSKLGSVGKPVLHLDVKIVNDDGHEVGSGVPGELLLKGPKVFSGYLRDPEATADSFIDGWFRTGDIAHRDDDGYIFIDDRKKDIIISGGENIASTEVERVLYLHPAVLEAAVIGVADERWGQVPRAVIVVREGAELSAADVIAHCTENLAKFKVPRDVKFVRALPRTASGKVLKRELR